MSLRSMQLGEDEFLAAIKIQWKAELTALDVAVATNALEARIREEIPRARYLFIETDVFDPQRDDRAEEVETVAELGQGEESDDEASS